MLRAGLLAIPTTFILAASAQAQTTGALYKWQAGQVLTYQIEHSTSVAEVVGGSKVETASKLKLLKRWQVVGVDAAGVATIQLSLGAMRHEQSRPGGEVLLYDSAAPDKSTPELREAMKKYIGTTLAILRIDGQGRILEVKQGSAAQYESEPPFPLILTGKPFAEGQAWRREYNITVEPPLGTGEKYQAAQHYRCTKVTDNLATVSLTTELKSPPASQLERLPLLQKMPEGEIVFDVQAGRIERALSTTQEVQGHQGEGSSYKFQSSYQEQYLQP